jgi:hypothetical protein
MAAEVTSSILTRLDAGVELPFYRLIKNLQMTIEILEIGARSDIVLLGVTS